MDSYGLDKKIYFLFLLKIKNNIKYYLKYKNILRLRLCLTTILKKVYNLFSTIMIKIFKY